MPTGRFRLYVRKHTTFCKALLIAVYLLLILLPLTFALLSGTSPRSSLLYEIGKAAAIIAFTMLCLQVVLVSRCELLDAVFGIDAAAQFHKVTAICAVCLLIAHPILLAAASGRFDLFSADSWKVDIGKLTLAFLLLTVAFALTFAFFAVDYNIWRFLHKSAVLLVLLAFAHSFLIGSDLNNLTMQVTWFALLAVAASVFIWRNAVAPWRRRRFTVTDVRPETHDTFTLTFEPEDGRSFPRDPGQFMFLKLKRPARRSEIHPFTISASPTRQYIVQATIKKSGNFTNTIDRTRPGDKGFIEGPFGKFSLVNFEVGQFLFIAGGVGITPLMSMLRYLKETGDTRPVTFLYANKTTDDIIFRKELETMPSNVKVVHILSRPNDSWQGPRGRIDPQFLRQYAGDILSSAHVFLCGPPPMMTALKNHLKNLAVPSNRVHFERFTL